MHRKNIKNLFAADSVYTLLQYLLLKPQEEWDETFFFWGNSISDSIKMHFKTNSATILCHKSFYEVLRYYYFVSVVKWPFLLKDSLRRYGCDHYWFSCWVFRKKTFELLEDGALNYIDNDPSIKWKNNRFSKFKKLLLGPTFISKSRVGTERTCTKIHLTGLMDAEIMNDPRVEVNSFEKMWNASSCEKKKRILEILCIDRLDIEAIKQRDVILLTDPFSEHEIISEGAKINLYKQIVNYIGGEKKLVIKVHPREITNYNDYFKEAYIIKERIPVQILSMIGIKFKAVYTICSTASLDFPYQYDLVYFGTDIDEKLSSHVPTGLRSAIGGLSKNINLLEIDEKKLQSCSECPL